MYWIVDFYCICCIIYLFIYLFIYLGIYLSRSPIIIFDFSRYAAESDSSKTGEIWQQGAVHRRAHSRDTEDSVADSVADSYRDREETVFEFGGLKPSVLMIRYRNTFFLFDFVLLRYNLDIGRNSLRYRSPIAWELTPTSLKQSHSLKNFKILLTTSS